MADTVGLTEVQHVLCNVSIVELVVISQPAVRIVSFSGHEWDQYLDVR